MHAHRVVFAALTFTLAACAAPAARVAAVGLPPSSSAPPAAVAALPSTPTTGPPATDLVVPAAPAAPEPVHAAAATEAADYTSIEPCGGDLPPCYVKWRESHGNYQALNASSGASGAWQFLDSTWAGYGGYSKAMWAPPEVQDERARELWAGGAGCSHWSAC